MGALWPEYLDGLFRNKHDHNAATVAEANQQRYDAVLRISEALSACSEPEELARVLAEQLGHISFVLWLKENSNEIEWRAHGKARCLSRISLSKSY